MMCFFGLGMTYYSVSHDGAELSCTDNTGNTDLEPEHINQDNVLNNKDGDATTDSVRTIN